MVTEPAHPLTSYAAYRALPEGRYDLLDGELLVTPAPSRRHQLLQLRLAAALLAWVEARGSGHVYGAPLDVELRQEDPAVVVQPDVVYVAAAGPAALTAHGVSGPPDLVVEVVSPGSTRLDGVRKRAIYESFGVGEYWLVLPDLDQVEVLVREPGRAGFAPPRLLEHPDALTSQALPGFELALAHLFRPEPGVAG